MDLRQIRYFIAVAKEKNFTMAAKALFISQPPLSRQIQLLEDELGVKLLARNSRPLKLTEAGKVFYEQSLDLLSRVEQMKRATQQVGKNERRIFSIGFVPSILYGGLPGMIKKLQQEWPDTDVQLIEILSSQQPEALRTGRIDIGFGRLRSQSPDISRVVLLQERLMVAMPYGHALYGPKDVPLPLKALEDQSLIIYPKGPRPTFADTISSLLRDYNLNMKDVREVSELQTALGLVAADTGVSIVPVSVKSLRSDLCYRLLGDDNLTTPVILSYRMNENANLIETLLELFKTVYGDPSICSRDQK